jgi:hypothetical protein
LATTTILDSGLPGNSHSGANQNRRPGVPAYLEQVVYAAAADPNSPGAYRYVPDSADPIIPDSDPRSPRYEPPHLRHRPGDTWIIDRTRPHDPLDPGPYGSPDWCPDDRTGRHRRGELPDAPPETGLPEPTDRPSPGPAPEGAGKPRPTSGRSGGEPPQPPRRPRPWADDDGHRYDFGRLREGAWTRFLAESQELHHAHFIPLNTAGDRRPRFWRVLKTFLFRMIGLSLFNKGTQLHREPTEVVLMREQMTGGEPSPISADPQRTERTGQGGQKGAAVGAAKVKRPSPLSGTPLQGAHRTSWPYIVQWERHFDAAQAFREAVAL